MENSRTEAFGVARVESALDQPLSHRPLLDAVPWLTAPAIHIGTVEFDIVVQAGEAIGGDTTFGILDEVVNPALVNRDSAKDEIGLSGIGHRARIIDVQNVHRSASA
jgi:hypothetical protein